MPASLVIRPIVRSFQSRFARNAARHVRAGGHAVVWEGPRRAHLVFRVPARGDEMDLGSWSALDLGKMRWRIFREGPMRGLAATLVPKDCLDIVTRRAERDSIFPGPTRTMSLDCLDCGACCRDNEVILDRQDLARFAKGGRSELARPPYAKRKGGRIVLLLAPGGRCLHLKRDNKCRVYDVRPNACRLFPMGSECCLFSREEEFGIIDGVGAGE